MINAVALVIFLVLLLFSIPISYAMGLISVILLGVEGLTLTVATKRMIEGINVFPLLAVPLFIFAGSVMSRGGLAKRMIGFVQALVGWVRGGLALANIGASMLFGGVSGSCAADISSIGTILIPAMEEEGYDREFATAVTVTSATMGPIIPPSIPAVIYAYVAGNISVAGLFLANLIPGILIGLALMVVAYVISVKRQYPKEEFVGFVELGKRFGNGLLGLGGFLIIVGGTTAGIYTATEAGGIASVYALVVAMVIYRELKFSDLPRILLETALTTSLVMFLVGTTSIFSWYLGYSNVPQDFAKALLNLTQNPYLILLILNVLLFIVGAFIDTTPALMLLVPILVPLGAQVGINPYHLGSIIVVNLVFGLITPPVGTSLFVGCSVSKLPIEVITKEMKWLFLSMICILLLITFVPELTTAVPRALGLIR